jgi:hypothetical protein
MKHAWKVMAFLLLASAAVAQGAMDNVIANLIHGFQTGTVDLRAFTQPVQQQIVNQTQGTLRYLPLAQLGPLRNVTFLGSQQLPSAVSYWYRSAFSSGVVDWQVTVGADSVIQYFEFHGVNVPPPPAVGSQPPPPQPGASQAPQPGVDAGTAIGGGAPR